MPKRQLLIAQLRQQAASVLQAIEEQIAVRETELEELRSQLATWRRLLGVDAVSASKRSRRLPTRKGGRVNWDSVLASLPSRFGVKEVLKNPDAARRGRVQVYQALTRWELAKRVRRIEKGVYEKTGKPAEPPAVTKRKGRARPGK